MGLAGDGVLYAFTVVRQAPAGFTTPYVLGLVDLPADEVRVTARIVGVDPGQVEVGTSMVLTTAPFEPAGETPESMFAFAPAPSAGEA